MEKIRIKSGKFKEKCMKISEEKSEKYENILKFRFAFFLNF